MDGMENTEGTRPTCTAPRRWPKRPVAGTGGPSVDSLRKRPKRPVAGAGTRHAHGDGDGECQPGVERRRDGADEPRSWVSVARCGVGATGPGVGKGPSEGSTRGVLGARNECSNPRRMLGEIVSKGTIGTPYDGGGSVNGGVASVRRSPEGHYAHAEEMVVRPPRHKTQRLTSDLLQRPPEGGVGDTSRGAAGQRAPRRTVAATAEAAAAAAATWSPDGRNSGNGCPRPHAAGHMLEERSPRVGEQDHVVDYQWRHPGDESEATFRGSAGVEGSVLSRPTVERPLRPPGEVPGGSDRGAAGQESHRHAVAWCDGGSGNDSSAARRHVSEDARGVRPPLSPTRAPVVDHRRRSCGDEPEDIYGGEAEVVVLHRAVAYHCDARGSPRALQPRVLPPPPAARPQPAPPGPRGAHLAHRGQPLCRDGGGDHGTISDGVDFTAGTKRHGATGARPAASLRRRITGKRKMVDIGDPLSPAQLSGSASSFRSDAESLHDSSGHRLGDDRDRCLLHGVVGNVEPRAMVIEVSMSSSTSQGSGGSREQCGRDADCGLARPLAAVIGNSTDSSTPRDCEDDHVQHGGVAIRGLGVSVAPHGTNSELNTLKSTSPPTPSPHAGRSSSCTPEAAAAFHAQQSVG